MISKITDAYRQSIDNAELVSFDVFDTLIHRTVFRPVHVFDLLAKRLLNTDLALHNARLVSNLPQLREAYERHAREQHFTVAGTHEITLRDIYVFLRENTGIDQAIIEHVLEEELRVEHAVAYANPWMKSIYEYAIAQGKKVILCSDMYLSTETITNLLIKAGFSAPFTLFVSGEIKKSKHEGSMFQLICEQFGVPPAKIAHFGDNKHSDFVIPNALGIKAHHFDVIQSTIEPQLRFSSKEEHEDRAIISLIQGAIRNILVTSKHAPDFWSDIGTQVFGPLFLGKFLWMINHLRQEPVDKVLFFARDAFFSHLLYERYARDLGVNAQAEYVYFSRAALLIPSFTDMNIHRVWHLFSGRSPRSVKHHLIRLNINPSLVRREILESGFESENDSANNSDIRMFNLLNKLYPFILEAAKRGRELAAGYVRQVAESSHRIGIVDIGWTGNMQGSFSRILQMSRNDFELIGYYYGTFELIFANYLPRNTYRSYLVHEAHPRNLCDSLVNGGVELMEFAHMAPHGTTLGYEDINGKICPILENNQQDRAMQDLAVRVQQGAIRFVEAVMPAVLSIGAEHLVSKAWSEPFFRLVNQPTLEEAGLLGELTHSDTATDTLRRLPLAEKLPPAIARRRGTDYWNAYQQAYWKKAFEIRNS